MCQATKWAADPMLFYGGLLELLPKNSGVYVLASDQLY
jgi:hypothetical protein